MSFHAMNRRTFLQTATTVTAATFLTSRFAWAAGDHKIEKVGVQLYTIRDEMKTDFDGSLAKVAAIGYKEVEFAGYFGRTPQQVRAALEKNGLTSPACHLDYDLLAPDQWPAQIESAKVIGQDYIVNPWIPEPLRKTDDDWKRVAETFNRAGAESKKAGVQFAYHNHWFEFMPVNGKLPYDTLLTLCDKDLVKMEMDLCWITVGGGDPLKYFDRYPGRFPLVHVKDVKKIPRVTTGGEQNFGDTVDLAAVGSGIIDWKRIFAQSDKAGIKHYIVEHDKPAHPFESITESYEYLSKLRW
ncbi:MAG: sugar phosphate isomerase/epimerase [Candidatus Sulfotelmatobacter sp.]|jgi:sugar phosphate isomerase/epimerase